MYEWCYPVEWFLSMGSYFFEEVKKGAIRWRRVIRDNTVYPMHGKEIINQNFDQFCVGTSSQKKPTVSKRALSRIFEL